MNPEEAAEQLKQADNHMAEIMTIHINQMKRVMNGKPRNAFVDSIMIEHLTELMNSLIDNVEHAAKISPEINALYKEWEKNVKCENE